MEKLDIEKNQEYIVKIIDNGYDGEGIAKVGEFIVFIPGTIKNETCKIIIVKIAKNYAYGKLLEVIEKSGNRKEIDCTTYPRCGGCSLRHVDYAYTLKMKQAVVQNLVDKTLKNNIQVNKTIGMEEPVHYRNKLQYPVGRTSKGENAMGVFAKRTHEIIPVNHCFIQNEKSEEIAKYIFKLMQEKQIPVYNEKTREGQIRHIVIKTGIKTNEFMCIIVTNERKIKDEDKLVEEILSRFPNITTIIKNVNDKNTNVILGKENIVLYGSGYITDQLGEYTFKISPMSFYQTNPVQTEILYNTTIKYADLNKEDILCDLYCGIGTIGIFASKYVKEVYGIEIVEEAIEMAKENAKINNVNNIKFMAGDVEKVWGKMLEESKITPTVIFVDPPRKGLDNNTVEKLLEVQTQKVIYISCNPATMVRDLAKLEEKYRIEAIQPIDMFPFSSHVECVAVLKLKADMECIL